MIELIDSLSQKREIEAAITNRMSVVSREGAIYHIAEQSVPIQPNNLSSSVYKLDLSLLSSSSSLLPQCSCFSEKANNKNRRPSTFCRHSVFIMATVARIYDPDLYNQKRRFYGSELRELTGRLNSVHTATTTYSDSVSPQDGNQAHHECSICLEDVHRHELSVECQYCHKAYHENCASEWTIQSSTCPTCRYPNPFIKSSLPNVL